MTVNSNKVDRAQARSLWGPKWIANLTDAIGISNSVITSQTHRKEISRFLRPIESDDDCNPFDQRKETLET